MRSRLSFIIASALIGLASPSPAQTLFFNEASGHWYKIVGPGTFAACQAEAEALGGGLASYLDGNEEFYVRSVVAPHIPAIPGVTGLHAFIGLVDIEVEGQFHWLDGSPLTFGFWAPGQPDNAGNEDCVEIVGPSFQWNDISVNAVRYGIAELPAFVFENLGRRYQFTSAPLTRANAEAEAQALGGTLLQVDDNSERLYVEASMGQFIPVSVGPGVWIGLNDLAQEGVFRWPDGSLPVITNWDVGEPNNANGNEDGVVMRPVTYRWNDVSVTTVRYGIIEYCVPAFGISAYNGAGSLRVRTCHPVHQGRTVVTIITQNTAGVGLGWFYGINPTIFEIVDELSFGGPPFLDTLNAQGMATYDIPSGVPAGLAFAGVPVIVDTAGVPLTSLPPVQITTL